MPPKPKPKPKPQEAAPPPSEFDGLDMPTLQKLVGELKADTVKAASERAEALLDKSSLEGLFGITKREMRELELAILSKDREMELLAENHRVDVKAHQQKVKALEYEHSLGMKKVESGASEGRASEEQQHSRKVAALHGDNSALRARIREAEESNLEMIQAMRVAQDKNVTKMREEFRLSLEQLRGKYDARQQQLVDDLRLRQKVEVHELEERKNLHINQLMKAHQEAFLNMKKYYNDITRSNLELITQLKSQIAEANEKVAANQKLMREIAEQNTKLKHPLEAATKNLSELKEVLKDAEKDRQSLRLAKARLVTLRTQTVELEVTHKGLESRFASVSAERDELYEKFEAMVDAVRARSESRQSSLETRLAEVERHYETKKMEIREVVSAAKLDPSIVSSVYAALDAALDSRSELLHKVQESTALLTKAHNDAAHVLAARLKELGVPSAGLISTLPAGSTGTGPAGLVVKPSIP